MTARGDCYNVHRVWDNFLPFPPAARQSAVMVGGRSEGQASKFRAGKHQRLGDEKIRPFLPPPPTYSSIPGTLSLSPPLVSSLCSSRSTRSLSATRRKIKGRLPAASIRHDCINKTDSSAPLNTLGRPKIFLRVRVRLPGSLTADGLRAQRTRTFMIIERENPRTVGELKPCLLPDETFPESRPGLAFFLVESFLRFLSPRFSMENMFVRGSARNIDVTVEAKALSHFEPNVTLGKASETLSTGPSRSEEFGAGKITAALNPGYGQEIGLPQH